MVTKVEYPVAPTVTPLRGTLLDVATLVPQFAWLDGNGLFDSYNCMTFRESTDFCAPSSKDLDQTAIWQDGFRFAVYGGLTCKRIGLDPARMKSEAQRVFEQGEAVAVEQALMAQRFVENIETAPDPDVTHWLPPEDIAPSGGAASPAVGVALLEGYAASAYVGVPTLHLPRTVASLMLSTQGLAFSGNALTTPLGSKGAAGGGYDVANPAPDGVAADEGTYWLYATGEVIVSRADLTVADAFDTTENDVYVLVERPYMAAVDCFTAAVQVTLEV